MALPVTELNGVKVYNLTSGKTLPQWLAEKTRSALKKDEAYRNRVELLQDFDFNTASQRVKMSKDGLYCVSTGTYPPMVKVFEVEQMAMKFERHLDAEVVNFEILDDSWGKLAFLHVDRTVEFHAPYGRHYRTRVPCAGRDLLYHKASCDLFVAASSSDIYRLNLEEGRFLAPVESCSDAVNVLAQSLPLQLMVSGGDDGVVQCWDMRVNKAVAAFDLNKSVRETGLEVTALEFDPRGGITMAAGSSKGHVALLDLRSTTPLITKEHQYGDPIVRVRFHTTSNHIISADSHVLKIWDRSSGKIMTNIEPQAACNDFCIVPVRKTRKSGDSGVLMVAGEQSRIMSFYTPQLGVAPHWCSFLDSLTEGLEESVTQDVFGDYKFVTREELRTLGLQHLVGSPLLKSFMHGFFMDARLYRRVQTVADPFAYEKYRKKQVKEKIEARRKSRITIQRRLPKVNQDLAVELMAEAAKSKKEAAIKKALGKEAGDEKQNAVVDPRFSAMFTNPDFQIDAESDAFRRAHSGNLPRAKAKPDITELFDEVDAFEARHGKGKGKKVQMFELSEAAASAGTGAVGLGGDADAAAIEATRTAHARALAPISERLQESAEAEDRANLAKNSMRRGGVMEHTFTPEAELKKEERKKKRSSSKRKKKRKGGEADSGREGKRRRA